MCRLIISLFSFFILFGCVTMERGVEALEIKAPASGPVLAPAADSLMMFKAKSAIQRSPEYLFSSFVVIDDKGYSLSISNEELAELRISEKDYQRYIEKLSNITPKQ